MFTFLRYFVGERRFYINIVCLKEKLCALDREKTSLNQLLFHEQFERLCNHGFARNTASHQLHFYVTREVTCETAVLHTGNIILKFKKN